MVVPGTEPSSTTRPVRSVMAAFRPLKPAPMEEEPQPAAKPLLAQKPKRTVTLGACVACRKRKSKCNGNRPICSCCAQKDTHCVYELGPNEKPSQAMKRKNEEMQGELSHLRQLYDLLRQRPEHEALAILRKIRAEPSASSPAQHVQSLTNSIRHGQLASESPTMPQTEPTPILTLPPIRLALNSLSPDISTSGLPFTSLFPLGYDEPTTQRRRQASDADVSARVDSSTSPHPPITIDALLLPEADISSDPRLKATPKWTSVSKDTQFLTLLMTLWYKWEYTYYHYLDWDLFLDDLSTGRTDFCSELLVNALLATASFQSSLVKNRSKPFYSDSYITRFYREARRLWEADETTEEEEQKLTRVQAALALFMVFGKHGRDRVGYMFLQEACRLARKQGLFRLPSSSTQRPQHVPQDKWDRARAVTAWTLFNFQLTMSFTYSLPPLINSPPPVAIPYEGMPGPDEDLFRDECDRSVILLDCLNTLIDPNDPTLDVLPKLEEVEILYLRLKSWFDHRTPSSCPTKHPSPQNILAAMQYHVSVMRLFQPFTNYESSNDRISLYRDQALKRTTAATKELYQLIQLHETRHGWACCIGIVLHILTTAAYASLDEISRQEDPVFETDTNEFYKGLLACLTAIGAISAYNFYAQPLFRLLTQSSQALDVPLPSKLVNVLDRFQSDEWTKTAASMVSSHYIADMRKTASASESARMDTIISRWDALTLKDRKTPPHDGS